MTIERNPWSFSETRRLVQARFGDAQVDLISPCLDSLLARQLYAAHHLERFEGFVADHLAHVPDGWKPMRLILAASADKTRRNQELRTRLAAEATACAASLHCPLDTLGRAVAYSLGLNRGEKPSDRSISNGWPHGRRRLSWRHAVSRNAALEAVLDRPTEAPGGNDR